jgi:4a-hydroxytetrahydrobiopterin dehydratase
MSLIFISLLHPPGSSFRVTDRPGESSPVDHRLRGQPNHRRSQRLPLPSRNGADLLSSLAMHANLHEYNTSVISSGGRDKGCTLSPGADRLGPVAALTETEIADALPDLPGWAYDGERISKEFSFPTFMQAIAFINRVAEAAEAADHHPDLENQHTKVIVAFRSWDVGGVTTRDLRMATRVEGLAG